MRTISRSKRTVVVRVSWERVVNETHRHKGTKAQRRANKNFEWRAFVPACLCVFVLFRSHHIEGKCKCVDLVVSAKLRPGAVASGFRHQAFEGHIRAAAQFLE